MATSPRQAEATCFGLERPQVDYDLDDDLEDDPDDDDDFEDEDEDEDDDEDDDEDVETWQVALWAGYR